MAILTNYTKAKTGSIRAHGAVSKKYSMSHLMIVCLSSASINSDINM